MAVLDKRVDAFALRRELREPALSGLRARLEAWLPVEAERLQRAGELRQPVHRREAEWRLMLSLYERLCAALPADRPDQVRATCQAARRSA